MSSPSSDTTEVIRNWLSGASLEALQLPQPIILEIKHFVNECRHRKLVENSVADGAEGKDPSKLIATSSVTLKVAQRCANIIKSLVDWYVRDELNKDLIVTPTSATGHGKQAADFDSANTTSDSKHLAKLKGRSIHSYIALSAIRQRYVSNGKDFEALTASEVTATQVVYLVLLIDKVGRKLANATAFHAVASNITMRALAIVKRALEVPGVLMSQDAAVDLLKDRYKLDNGSSVDEWGVTTIGAPLVQSIRPKGMAEAGRVNSANSALNDPAMLSSCTSALPIGAAMSRVVGGGSGTMGGVVQHLGLDDTSNASQSRGFGQHAFARVPTHMDLHDEYDFDEASASESSEVEESQEGAAVVNTSVDSVATPTIPNKSNASSRAEAHPNGSNTASPFPQQNNAGRQNSVANFHQHTANAVKHFNSVKEATVRSASGKAVNFIRFAEYCTEELDLLQNSLESMTFSLCKHAAKHIYENETVLTIGCSHSTLAFFSEAAKTRSFRLIVLEGPPPHSSTKHLVRVLEKINPNVTVLVQPDSNAFAVMSYCSKVFVSCDSVLATGGALCPLGTHPVCVAAKMFSTPVIVIAMTVKLIPWLPIDPQCTSLIRVSKTQNHEEPCTQFSFPGHIFPTQEAIGSVAFGGGLETSVISNSWGGGLTSDPRPTVSEIDVVYNTIEYVPPHLISLFVTDADEFVGSHIHKYIRDLYRIEDSEF